MPPADCDLLFLSLLLVSARGRVFMRGKIILDKGNPGSAGPGRVMAFSLGHWTAGKLGLDRFNGLY